MHVLDFEKHLLEKGQSLAPVLTTYNLQDLMIGITEYPHRVKTGCWHAHENPMISFVLEGGNIENRKKNQIQRICGSINFYHSFESHQNIYQVFPSKHLSIEIDRKFLAKYELNENQIKSAVEENPFSKFTFLRILKEVLLNDSFTRESTEMLFLELINVPSFSNRGPVPTWVSELRDILNDKWNLLPTLQELSDEIGVHPVTISKNFRKYFSSTFGEYMRKIKIDRSLTMIRTTELPLAHVAYDCGFADQSHFTRIFKNQTGFLPKRYQQL